MVEVGQILVDRAARRLRRGPIGGLHASLAARVGLDQAAIDSKAFTTDETLLKASIQHRLEQSAWKVAIADRPCRLFEKVE